MTGYFGFRFNNLNQITQGFNVYRHGQLIYRHHHELYMGLGKTVRADHNSLVGELDLDINVNTVKSFLEDGEEKMLYMKHSKMSLINIPQQLKKCQ